MSSRVAETVAEFCKKQSLLVKNDIVVIGVSGGPDSLCLLHLFTKLRPEFDLSLVVAHLNHQLRKGQARADEDFVCEIASRWRLPFRTETRDVAALATQRKQSVEEAARQIRYAFLWRVAEDVGATKIAVGHQADDQVETILMHLLRGAGLAGLRGMLPQTAITGLRLHPEDRPEATTASPKLIRPLLEISRAEIETYCQEHGLSPHQDTTNQDTTFFRNRLRHELIPLLESYNPNIRRVLQRTAKVIAAEVAILDDHLEQTWHSIIKDEAPESIVFDLAQWLALPLALKRSTLRRAVQRLRHNLRDISFEHIENAVTLIENGATGTQATLPQGLMLIVGYQTITLVPDHLPLDRQNVDIPLLIPERFVPIKVPGVTPLPHQDWQLKATLVPADRLSPAQISQADRWEVYLNAEALSGSPALRTRQPGDRFYPFGLGGHSKKINEFMIDQKIPRGWRDFVPLLVANGDILWVCGYRADERARINPATKRILHLRFEKR